MEPAPPGKRKQYQPKVRTGCATCKTRRIKCDEGKPTCQRCLKGNLLCTYEAIDADSSGESFMMLRSQSSLAFPIPSQYGNNEEIHALMFYLQRSSPVLSMGSSAKDFWTVTVPQLSWTYTAVKQMLVAISMQDRNLVVNTSTAVETRYQPALNRYSQAINALTQGQPTMDCTIVASLLAWKFESIIGDLKAATVHMQAATEMVRECTVSEAVINSSSHDVVLDANEIIEQYRHQSSLYMNTSRAKTTKLQLVQKLQELVDDMTEPLLPRETSKALQFSEFENRLVHWRVNFHHYLQDISYNLDFAMRQLSLRSKITETFLAFQTSSSQRYKEQRQRHCVLNDIENLIQYEDLSEIKQELLLILNFFVIDVETYEDIRNRAVNLKERIISSSGA